MVQSPTELSGAATKLYITSEGFLILDALKIIVRSLYNCRVFGYYGGIQKLTALMKGIIIFFPLLILITFVIIFAENGVSFIFLHVVSL